MALTKNGSKFTKSNQVSKRRFILGSSECYFEPSQAYNADMVPEKLKGMLLNECKSEDAWTTITETEGEGKSLNVRFYEKHVDADGNVTEDVQHVGLITSSDWNMTLTQEHIAQVQKHITDSAIIERKAAKSVLDMF